MERQQITKTNQGDHQRATPLFAKPALPFRAPIHTFVQLQRTIGNRAVGRFIQTKLKINRPGDVYEQEADRVAEEVMRMPAAPSNVAPPGIQRNGEGICPQCPEEEETMQRRPLTAEITPLVQRQATPEPEEEEEEIIQSQEASGETPTASPSVETQINSIRGGGQPLPEPVRAFFEPRFGYDFSQVRVHTDARAAESARAVNALAYTVGRDVVFGTGQYAPDHPAGLRLLAHELTHTIQQKPVTQTIQRACPSCQEEIQARQRAGENCPRCEARLPREERQRVQEETQRIRQEREQRRRELRQQPREEENLQRKEISTPIKIQPMTSGPSLQRAGFWENVERFFGGGTFSEEELRDYLAFLRVNRRIEDDFDSDNKAREVVSRWKRGDSKYAIIPVEIKILLIKEMLSGFTGDDDEKAILDLLRGSTDHELAATLREISVSTLNDAFHWAEQDQLDALLAERGVGGRRQGGQAGRGAGAASPQIFSEESVLEAQERFMENALKGEARSHCIKIIHEFLPGLFAQDPELQARVTSRLGQLRQRGATYTIDHTGEALRSLNLASQGVEIFFGGNSGNHRVEPGALESSAWDTIMGMVGNEVGWHIFGLSVFNGYHSVTVFVNNRSDGRKLAYWADQWAIGPGENFRQAEGSVSGLRRYEKEGFDGFINDYTHSRWCRKSTCDNAHWRATLTIWKFYSAQVRP